MATKKKAVKKTPVKKQVAKAQTAAPPKGSPAAKMLLDLEKSGLTALDAKKLNLVPMSEAESVKLGLSRNGDGFIIPYFDASGKEIPMFRYRYFDDKVKTGILAGAKLRKYDQPPDSNPEVYFPKMAKWDAIQADAEIPIIITEGEKKAACATKMKRSCIAVGGVYSFARNKRFQDMLPALEDFKWSGRQVFICYDSDAITNRKVLIAEERLARALTDRGAHVYILRLPQEGTEKVGLDDYLVEAGVRQFDALCEATVMEGEWGISRELHKLNTEVIHINHPSMIVVFPNEGHPKNQPRHRTLSVHTFEREVFRDRKYTIDVETTNANGDTSMKKKIVFTAKEWLEWTGHSRADSMEYAPGEGTIVNGTQLNTWEGWAAQPVEGDVTLFLEYFDGICLGMTAAEKKWMMQWLAYPIQHPGTKMNTAVVFWSYLNGSGKTFLGYIMERIYGANFAEVNKEQLAGSFNGWAVNRQFVMGDEITGSNSRETADLLKGMITGSTVTINAKYQPTYSVRNCINYYFTSNHPDAVFVTGDDRRYFVHEITHLMPFEFFQRLDKAYKKQEFADALMYYLLTVDTSSFNPNAAAPKTSAKHEMVQSNMSEAAEWVTELREHPDNILRMVGSNGKAGMVIKHDLWSIEDLLALYQPENGSVRRRKPLTGKGLAMILKEQGFLRAGNGEAINVGGGVRQRVWCIRNPDDAKLSYAEASAKYQDERAMKSAAKKDRAFVKEKGKK